MQLTRAAATRALAAAAEAEAAHPTPASTHPTTPDAASPTPRTPDPNLAFTRLACAVRQAVKLESQIAAGAFARAPAAACPQHNLEDLTRAADHGLVSDALHRLTENHPDRWDLRETLDEAIEDTLATYPEDLLSTHFVRACHTLGLTPSLTGFPDFLVETLHPLPTSWPPSPDG